MIDGKVNGGSANAVKTESIPVKDRNEKLKEAITPTPHAEKSADKPAAEKKVDPVWENGKQLGLTENCIRVLMSRYLKKGPDGKCTETPLELFTRVTRTVAGAEAKYGKTAAEIKQIEKEYGAQILNKPFHIAEAATLVARMLGALPPPSSK